MDQQIVFTGICCLDIVSYLEHYPQEDSDVRNVEQVFTLGGNATNSTKVAVQLNARALLFSAIPSGNPLFDHLFLRYQLDTSLCEVRLPPTVDQAQGVPVTVVLVNLRNGSRTMFSSLGRQQWPTAKSFCQKFPSLRGFSWFHFEMVETIGHAQIVEMARHVHSLRAEAKTPVISVELEHPVEEHWLRQLLPMADLVFVAKEFALHQSNNIYSFLGKLSSSLGWNSMKECAVHFQDKFGAPHVTVVCPWGEKGVAAKGGSSPQLAPCSSEHGLIELKAHWPSSGTVLDTLAAGDCFIAGTVHYLNRGLALCDALEKATFLAGESVGQRGLAGLKLPPE